MFEFDLHKPLFTNNFYNKQCVRERWLKSLEGYSEASRTYTGSHLSL